MTRADTATASAAHWEHLAASAVAGAEWDRERGLDLSCPGSSPGDAQARLYRRVAESLRREAQTGRPHCSMCGLDHPNHQHLSLPSPRRCECGQASCPWCTHRPACPEEVSP